MNRVIIPANSSVGSALGFLNAPISYELVQSHYTTLTDFNLESVNDVISSISMQAIEIVTEGARDAELLETRSAYMRYVGQGHEIQVPIPKHALTVADIAAIKSAYDLCYSRLYGRTIPERDIEVLSWSVVVSTIVKTPVELFESGETSKPATSGERKVFLVEQNGLETVPSFWRPEMRSSDSFSGPVLVEEPQTTTFVTGNFSGKLDSQMNLILDRTEP
jgi:N-methylhydantoinase A